MHANNVPLARENVHAYVVTSLTTNSQARQLALQLQLNVHDGLQHPPDLVDVLLRRLALLGRVGQPAQRRARVHQRRQRADARLGFGRIVGSEIAAPNMLAIPV